MNPWIYFVYLGDTAFLVPAAAAIVGWLAAAGAWRMALYWTLLFAAGLGVVAVSKMAFIGWGIGIPAIGFHALSGHAMRTAAIAPVGLYLLLQGCVAKVRAAGILLGFGVAIWMSICLVAFGFHSPAEAWAGALIGSLVSLGFIGCNERAKTQSVARDRATRTGGGMARPAPRLEGRLVLYSLLVFLLVWQVKPAAFKHRMVNMALELSGRSTPYGASEHATTCAPGVKHAR